jgi:membrane-associated phospholipid phosphatase
VSAAGLTDVPVDREVALWFAGLAGRHPRLVDAGEVGAVLLHPYVFRAAVLVAAVLAWRAGRRRPAAVAAVTMAAAGLLTVGTKLLVQRPRPAWADPVAEEVGYSFPSSHALHAALGVGLLLLLARPLLAAGTWLVAAAAGALVVVLAALDRLVLGVHYLSDVTVGVAAGALGTGLAAAALRRRATDAGGRRSRPDAPRW